MKYLIGLTLCVLLVLEVTYAQSSTERPTRTPRTPRTPRPPRPSRAPRTPRPPPTGRPSRPPPPARCESADDCQQTECCLTHDITGFRKGVCLKLANEGKRCSLSERVINGKYLHSCPCVSGLSCDAEKIKKIPFVGEIRINERCVASNSTTSQPEQEGEE